MGADDTGTMLAVVTACGTFFSVRAEVMKRVRSDLGNSTASRPWATLAATVGLGPGDGRTGVTMGDLTADTAAADGTWIPFAWMSASLQRRPSPASRCSDPVADPAVEAGRVAEEDWPCVED